MAAGDITAVRSEASDVYSAASFDGVDDYVEIPEHPSQLGTNLSNGFTISAWINVRGPGENEGKVIDKTDGDDALNGYLIKYSVGGAAAIKINSGTTRATETISLKSWVHVLFTVAANSLCTGYINGTQSGVAGTSGALSGITSTRKMRIGNRAGTTVSTFDGFIKDVKMWNRVLTSDEIAADYAGLNNTQGQILWVPLKDDYNDKSTLGLTGTNSGTYLTNTLTNKIKADTGKGLNLGAATDKIIALPRRGSPVFITANRAAA